MNIYILPKVEWITLKEVIASVVSAGHYVTESLFDASYVIGIVGQDFPSNIPPEQKIILKEYNSTNFPGGAILCHIGTLRLFGTDQTLSQWLKNAPDLLGEKL